MAKLVDLAKRLGAHHIYLSALPSVVFYYYSKTKAEFVNRATLATVPLPPYILPLTNPPERKAAKVGGRILWPMSQKEADEMRNDEYNEWYEERKRRFHVAKRRRRR